jgi:uncharacterized repeat protein (TIGR01451 family)
MFHHVCKVANRSGINSTNVHTCNHLPSGTIFKAGDFLAESAAKNTDGNSLVVPTFCTIGWIFFQLYVTDT